MLGLPDTIKACLFDLDGVLTNTAAVHDAADYRRCVDGRPRADGIRTDGGLGQLDGA